LWVLIGVSLGTNYAIAFSQYDAYQYVNSLYIILRLYHIMDLRIHIFAVAIPALTFLAIMALLGVAADLQVWGQSNATNATESETSQSADGSIVNMTSSDFQPLQDFLNEAREAIHSNNTADALDALNEADNQLSELSNSTSNDTEGSDE
jgi:hypothetical protein